METAKQQCLVENRETQLDLYYKVYLDFYHLYKFTCKEEIKLKENKSNENIRWFITVFITTFLLSLFFSYISTTAISDIPMLPAILILLSVIAVGIIFDIIGVAVTVAGEEEFHAKASKKIPGAKTAVKLIRNAAKVANICADVIGDICRSIKWCD